MRVLHLIARLNVGGTSRWLNVLTHGLLDHGHEVLVVAGNVQDDEAESDVVESVPLRRLVGLGRSPNVVRDTRSAHEFRKIVKEFRPDIVNTHTSKAGAIGRLAVRSLGRHRPAVVHTIHGHVLTGYFSGVKLSGIRQAERSLSKISDLILAAGTQVASDVADEGLVNKMKLRTVFPGVSPLWLQELPVRNVLDQASGNRVVVGWLSRVVPIKRPDRLIALAQRNPGLKFVIGGEGELLSSLRETNLPNMELMGWVRAEEFWQLCDIAILTSDNEAVPYSLIEAGLSGLPSVTTPAGSVRDVIQDGHTGFVADFDSGEFGSRLKLLVKDHALRVRLGSNAREYCRNHFSQNQMVNRHLDVYEEAINLHFSS